MFLKNSRNDRANRFVGYYKFKRLSSATADIRAADETGFRDGITALGFPYVVGVRPATTVWPWDILPLPPKPWSGRGVKPVLLRTGPGHKPIAIKALAMNGVMRYEQ